MDPPSAPNSDATQLPMPLAVDQDLDQDSEPIREPVVHDSNDKLEPEQQPIDECCPWSKRKGKKSTTSTGKTQK